MRVTLLSWELAIPGCRSLKEKRSTVKSLRDKLRQRFNVSVAETGFHDIHDRAEITVVFVSTDSRSADAMASQLDTFVADNERARVVRSAREER